VPGYWYALGLQGYLAHKTPPPVGPYSSPMPRALWWSLGSGLFLMSEVPLYWYARCTGGDRARYGVQSAVERTWNKYASQGQILALALGQNLFSYPFFARQWLHAVATDVFHAACRFQSTRRELGGIILLGHFTRATRLTSLVISLPYHPRRIPYQGACRAHAGKGSRGLRAGGFARCVVLRGVHERAGELCLEQSDAGGARGVAAREKLVV